MRSNSPDKVAGVGLGIAALLPTMYFQLFVDSAKRRFVFKKLRMWKKQKKYWPKSVLKHNETEDLICSQIYSTQKENAVNINRMRPDTYSQHITIMKILNKIKPSALRLAKINTNLFERNTMSRNSR
jgi:hypothetical protein